MIKYHFQLRCGSISDRIVMVYDMHQQYINHTYVCVRESLPCGILHICTSPQWKQVADSAWSHCIEEDSVLDANCISGSRNVHCKYYSNDTLYELICFR